MISSFKIRNYKSILDILLTTNFNEGKAPNGYKEFPYHIFLGDKTKRVTPILSIYGANASGKSNIIEAFLFLQEIVENGLTSKLYIPNKLNSKYKDTLFEIEIFLNDVKYQYSISYNKTTILEEKLVANKNMVFHCKDKELLQVFKGSKIYNKNRLGEIYNIECKNEKQEQKSTLLSKLAKNYANLNQEITNVYNYIINKIDIVQDNRMCSGYNSLKQLSKEVGSDEFALKKITMLIKKFDIDIEEISYEIKNLPAKYFSDISWTDVIDIVNNDSIKFSQFYSYHKDIENDIQKFKFQEESAGTQTLLPVIGISLATLEKGGVLLVDELDKSIHPLLLIQLVKLFKDKRYNKNNAQLIFTLHCTDLLEDDLIRKSEVGIVSKTKKSGSTFSRLSEIKDLRNVLDFRKRYLMGEFSGIPHAYI